MTDIPAFATTHIGSVPHTEWVQLCKKLAATLDLPAWPQLPRRTFAESMYVQNAMTLPGIVIDNVKEKVTFDTSQDITSALETFYEHYLETDVAHFALPSDYAAGFYTMIDTLQKTSGMWAKGQVTGPISFGLIVTDQNLRASLYDETLVDVIVKNAAMSARWQVRQLHNVRPNVLLFVDEPYMASFGSAYISIQREQVINMLNEVFAAVHEEGGLVGVHCCGNTDWSVLLETRVDVLNLDAYDYLENLALYPAELSTFLKRGGRIAWGIVPNNEKITTTTPEKIAHRLQQGIDAVIKRAGTRGIQITHEQLHAQSLITPSCGLAQTTIAHAEQALTTLTKTASILRSN